MATYEELKAQAIAAYKAGDKAQARAIAEQAKAVLAQQRASEPPNMLQRVMQDPIRDSYMRATRRERDDQGFLGAVGQGASAGFSDEISGGLAALYAGAIGKDPAQASRAVREGMREDAAQYAKRNPKSALAGEALGGFLVPGMGAAKAASVAAKGGKTVAGIKRGMKLGAGLGALGAAGRAGDSFEERARAAAEGGLIGAAFGAAAPAVTGFARLLVRGAQLGSRGRGAEVARKGMRSIMKGPKKGSRADILGLDQNTKLNVTVRMMDRLNGGQKEAFRKQVFKEIDAMSSTALDGLSSAQKSQLRRIVGALYKDTDRSQQAQKTLTKLFAQGPRRARTTAGQIRNMLRQGAKNVGGVTGAVARLGVESIPHGVLRRSAAHPWPKTSQALPMTPEAQRLMMGFSSPIPGLMGSR